MEKPKSVTLFELNSTIRENVKRMFAVAQWVVAEISEINENQSGHCYLELIEKSTDSDQIIARAKATIWAFTYRMLKPYFESVTGQRLVPGLKVMLQVAVEFHESYGFSMNVKDIEPSYTLGDLTRKKQEIIKQLQDEGVFTLNKELELSEVPQRVAVISSDTAAGFGDFTNQLLHNPYGYKFNVKLFKAFMQGEEAEKSIISALDRIFESSVPFDVVVIIRGGGSQADLNCFNTYWLAYHITQFPTPIITGIGHERDQTIADMVAHTSVKTPTAAAEILISLVNNFDVKLADLYSGFISVITEKLENLRIELDDLTENFTSIIRDNVQNRKVYINSLGIRFSEKVKGTLTSIRQTQRFYQGRIKTSVHQVIISNNNSLEIAQKSLSTNTRQVLKSENQQLQSFYSRSQLLDPVRIMKKGYTLTFNNGMLIKSASQLKPGDVVTSKWFDGKADSIVQSIDSEK